MRLKNILGCEMGSSGFDSQSTCRRRVASPRWYAADAKYHAFGPFRGDSVPDEPAGECTACCAICSAIVGHCRRLNTNWQSLVTAADSRY